MSSLISVVVLCPNGRKERVKVNNNSSNLEVLENVCRKQGLRAEEFELKHCNKTLDLSNTVQFSNLVNNAQLELVRLTRSREENLIKIGLQLENGQRFVHSFRSSVTLWEILMHFRQNFSLEQVPATTPVCVYMRREISGEDALSQTTLYNLGLVTGNAIIRLINRQMEPESIGSDITMEDEASFSTKSEVTIVEKSHSLEVNDEDKSQTLEADDEDESMFSAETSLIEATLPGIISFGSLNPPFQSGSASSSSLSWTDVIVQLEDRCAFLFSLDEIADVPKHEFSDDFYNLTVEDIKVLMADLKQKRLDLENVPLQTQQMRESNMKKKAEKYPETVIKVHFPNRFVLQGHFKSTETVDDVLNFVRCVLKDQKLDFLLYTTPPKQKLLSGLGLMEANLVPGAVVYFGFNKSADNNTFQVLRPEMYFHFQSPKPVEISPPRECIKETINKHSSHEPSAGASTSPVTSSSGYSSSADPSKRSNVPKWFKLGNK